MSDATFTMVVGLVCDECDRDCDYKHPRFTCPKCGRWVSETDRWGGWTVGDPIKWAFIECVEFDAHEKEAPKPAFAVGDRVIYVGDHPPLQGLRATVRQVFSDQGQVRVKWNANLAYADDCAVYNATNFTAVE